MTWWTPCGVRPTTCCSKSERAANCWSRGCAWPSPCCLAQRILKRTGISGVPVLKAGELVKAIAPALGARGGGKPDMAQGAGSDPSGIDAAVSALRDAVWDAG